jgi:exodeoxyribonuclease VII large subunit
VPVRVQGDGAARDICAAIDQAHELQPDVIVLCRGGGSIEDLWAFNEEEVARAMHRARIPIVTGIGHETDFTIADFCSDLRGATPTGAAELLVIDNSVLSERVAALCARLQRSFSWRIDSISSRLERLTHFLSTFDAAFSQPTLRLDRAASRLVGGMSRRLERAQQRTDELAGRLRHNSPRHSIDAHQGRLDRLHELVLICSRQTIVKKHHQLQRAAAVLDSLSPLATLARGYSIVSTLPAPGCGSRLVTDDRHVAVDECIAITLHRGRLEARVTATHRSSTSQKTDRDSDD